jgi:tape measure domain-containing protein
MAEDLGGGDAFQAGNVWIGIQADVDPFYASIDAIASKATRVPVVRVEFDHEPLRAGNAHIESKFAHVQDLNRRLAQTPIKPMYDGSGIAMLSKDLRGLQEQISSIQQAHTISIDTSQATTALDQLQKQIAELKTENIALTASIDTTGLRDELRVIAEEERKIYYAAEIMLDDSAAIAKIDALKETIDKVIRLDVEQKISIESNRLDSTIGNQNEIFTKNLEKILRDANKESFFSKIGSILTAPIRALGQSFVQVGVGAVRAVGEAAIKPFEETIGRKAKPITQLVGNQSENLIKTGTVALARFSGYESTSKFRKETFEKIEDLTNFNPKKVFKAVGKFEDNLVSILESLYVEKDSSAAMSKVKEYTKEIIEQPVRTLFELGGVGLRVAAQPLRIRKRVELLNTIKEAEEMAADMVINMPESLKKEIQMSKGVHLATGGIDYNPTAENAVFSANLTKNLTPGFTTIPVRNTYSNDVNTLGSIYQLTKGIPGLLQKDAPDRAPMPLDKLLDVAVEKGRNKDAVKLLAQAMAVRKIAPDKPIIITGTSGGSALVEETIGAAERSGMKNIKGVGLTLPMMGLTNTASKENFKSFFGTLDNIGIAFLGQRFRPEGGVSRKAWDQGVEDFGFPLIHTGLLAPNANTMAFPGIGANHHLGKFVGNSNVQDAFTAFTGAGTIDPQFMGKVSHVIPQVISSQSELLDRTLGVILGSKRANDEVDSGKFSFLDRKNPSWRRDNDLQLTIEGLEKEEAESPKTYKKLSKAHKKEYEDFKKYLKELKIELTAYYESAELIGKDISELPAPESLKMKAMEGKKFTAYRQYSTQPEYIPPPAKVPLGQTNLFQEGAKSSFSPAKAPLGKTNLSQEGAKSSSPPEKLFQNTVVDTAHQFVVKDILVKGNIITGNSSGSSKSRSYQQETRFPKEGIEPKGMRTVASATNEKLIQLATPVPQSYNQSLFQAKINTQFNQRTLESSFENRLREKSKEMSLLETQAYSPIVNSRLIANNKIAPQKNNQSLFEENISNQFNQQTYDRSFQNKINAEDRDRPISASEVVTPLNTVISNFVKFGRYLSEDTYRSFQQMIFRVDAVNQAFEFATPTLNEFKATVRNTDTQVRSMFSSVKQLERLMVGNLADRYRQSLGGAATQSAQLIGGLAKTQLRIGANNLRDNIDVAATELYIRLTNGIDNAIEETPRYKAILKKEVTNLFVYLIETYNQLSALEKERFGNNKLLYLAKFGLQAGAIAASPLALPAAGAGAAQGAELAQPIVNLLQGTADLLGNIPLAGEGIKAGIEAVTSGIVDLLINTGAEIGAAGAGAVGTGVAKLAEAPVQKQAQKYANENQRLKAEPGSARLFLRGAKREDDDFTNAIKNAENAYQVIGTLGTAKIFDAEKLAKVAKQVGIKTSKGASRNEILSNLETLAPDLAKLQTAIIEAYRPLRIGKEFVNAIIKAKDTSQIIETLKDSSLIEANKVYQIALKVGGSVSSKTNKTEALSEIENVAPELQKLQAAVIQTYHQLTGVSRAEREQITTQYNTFVSKVKAERSALLSSPLSDDEIVSGLNGLVEDLNEFALSVNVTRDQLKSLQKIKRDTAEEIPNVSRPGQRVNTEVIGSDGVPLRINTKTEAQQVQIAAKPEEKRTQSKTRADAENLQQPQQSINENIKTSSIRIDASTVIVNQKRSSVAEIPVSELNLDPKRFQYKLAPTATGSTGSLSGVQKFDQNLAGVVQVWRDPKDGKDYVINGHNRVTLAKDLGVENLAVRYIDASTAEEARAIGAKTNIAEGRGTPLDAAKFFRDSGITSIDQLKQIGIPLKESVATQGLGLAKLAPDLFDRTISGDIPVERASIIGQGLEKPEDQRALVQLLEKELKRGKKINNDVLKELIDVVKSSSNQTEQQTTLFGIEETTKNLALEKAQLQASVRRTLGKDSRLFGTVAKQTSASALERGGNTINVQQSAAIAEQSTNALKVFDQLKDKAGEISNLLNEGAKRLASGENVRKVESDILAGVLKSVENELSQFRKIGNESGEFLQEGFSLGLKEPISEKAASEMTEDVKTAVNKGFGIASPSKWAYQVGKFIQEGLALGLGTDKAVVASEALATAVITATESKLKGKGKAIADNFATGLTGGKTPDIQKLDRQVITNRPRYMEEAKVENLQSLVRQNPPDLKPQIKADQDLAKALNNVVRQNPPQLKTQVRADQDLAKALNNVVRQNPPDYAQLQTNEDLVNNLNKAVRQNSPSKVERLRATQEQFPDPFSESDYRTPKPARAERSPQQFALPSAEIRRAASDRDLERFLAGPVKRPAVASDIDGRSLRDKYYQAGEGAGVALGKGINKGVEIGKDVTKKVVEKIPEPIKEAFKFSPDAIKGFVTGLRAQFESLKEANPILGTITGGIKSLALAAGVGFVGYQAFDILKTQAIAAYEAIKKLQSQKISLEISTGNLPQALDFTKSQADKLGLSLNSVRDGYGGIAAALRGGKLAPEGENITRGFLKAVGGLQLSDEDSTRVFQQLKQIASKPKLQTEDLITLSESLPGAPKIAERALGLKNGELPQLLQTGQITSEEAVPKLAAQFEKEFGDAVNISSKSAQAIENRFGTAAQELQQKLGENALPLITEGFKVATGALQFLNDNLGSLTALLNTGLLVALAYGAKAVGTLVISLGELVVAEIAAAGGLEIFARKSAALAFSAVSKFAPIAAEFLAIAVATKVALDLFSLFTTKTDDATESLKRITEAQDKFNKTINAKPSGPEKSKGEYKDFNEFREDFATEDIGAAEQLKEGKRDSFQYTKDAIFGFDFLKTQRLQSQIEGGVSKAEKKIAPRTQGGIDSIQKAIQSSGGIEGLSKKQFIGAKESLKGTDEELRTLSKDAQSIKERNVYEGLRKQVAGLLKTFETGKEPTLQLAKAFKELDAVNIKTERNLAEAASRAATDRGAGIINDYQAQTQAIRDQNAALEEGIPAAQKYVDKLKEDIAKTDYDNTLNTNKAEDEKKLLAAEKELYGKRKELGESFTKSRELEYNRRSELLQREVAEQERAITKLESLRRVRTTKRDAALAEGVESYSLTPQALRLQQSKNTVADTEDAIAEQEKKRQNAIQNLKKAQSDLRQINPNDEQQFEQGKAAVAQYEQAVSAAEAEINGQRKTAAEAVIQYRSEIEEQLRQQFEITSRKNEQSITKEIQAIDRVSNAQKRRVDNAIAGYQREQKVIDLNIAALDRVAKLSGKRAELSSAINQGAQIPLNGLASEIKDAEGLIAKLKDKNLDPATRGRTQNVLDQLGISNNEQDAFRYRVETEDRIAKLKAESLSAEIIQSQITLDIETRKEEFAAKRAIIEAEITKQQAEQAALSAQTERRKAEAEVRKSDIGVRKAEEQLGLAQLSGDPNKIQEAQLNLEDARISKESAQDGLLGAREAEKLAKDALPNATLSVVDALENFAATIEGGKLSQRILGVTNQNKANQFNTDERSRRRGLAIEGIDKGVEVNINNGGANGFDPFGFRESRAKDALKRQQEITRFQNNLRGIPNGSLTNINVGKTSRPSGFTNNASGVNTYAPDLSKLDSSKYGADAMKSIDTSAQTPVNINFSPVTDTLKQLVTIEERLSAQILALAGRERVQIKNTANYAVREPVLRDSGL